jgi:hypothetical protein
MRLITFLATAALLAGFARADALPPPAALEQVTLMRVHGEITIDAEGKVTALEVDPRVPDSIAANVVRIGSAWRFHPVVVDGRPTAAKARLRLVLTAQSIGDGYEARVDSVSFPGLDDEAAREGFARGSTRPPLYPRGLMYAGVTGSVSLLMRVGVDGRVEEVVAAQTFLDRVRGPDETLKKAIGMFESSALEAARRWTVKVPADIATRPPERRTVAVSVSFILGGRPDASQSVGRWESFVRAPFRDAPWMPRSQGKAALANAEAGGLGAAGQALELVADAEGQPLGAGA